MKFLNELSRNLAVVSSKSKIRVGSQIGSNMQIERREWKETLMKKWSLIPRFKVWKWNHISVALGNWISGRKKKHWAQPCLFFFFFCDWKNLKSKLCIDCSSGKKKLCCCPWSHCKTTSRKNTKFDKMFKNKLNCCNMQIHIISLTNQRLG